MSERSQPVLADHAPLVISEAAELIGEFRIPESLVLKGYVDGLLRAKTISVTASGEMTGIIVAEVITVEGCLNEVDIFANLVILRNGSQVTGRIFCRTLEIDPGALFEGAHRRHEDPIRLSKVDGEA